MNSGIGGRHWAIAEGYIPAQSTNDTRQLESHETICLLNAGDAEACIEVMVYFADREPG
ncbi:MAG: sensory rhodopsin transducer [Gammaproteobacteria bacterium]